MRKIKEVLRLRNELKLDQRQIARSCSISVSTVHEGRLATARRLGRRSTGGGAVSACRFTPTTIHAEVPAGLRGHPRAVAASS